MSKKRQPPAEDDIEGRLDIRCLAVDYPSGYTTHSHSHVWHQLIYASRGVMTVNTQSGSWVVPAKRAVWVPANVVHDVAMHGLVSMRTLYIRERISRDLPAQCCVLNVSPLLRELILRSVEIGMLDRTNPTHKHLIDVLLDQLQTINSIPLQLPMPLDPRAARLADLLRQTPGETRPLHELAQVVGASKRTIERAFVIDVNMTFGKWRQQLRLLSALRLLAEGQSVTAIALEVGYESPSAFISAFKTMLGTTPGRYYIQSK
jgi:AraC-like DNA-binding protein